MIVPDEGEMEPTDPNKIPTKFGDPSKYEHLSQEERKELTKKMKSDLLSRLVSFSNKM